MADFFRIRMSDGLTEELLATRLRIDGLKFVADQPPATADVDVVSLELISGTLPRPIRFELGSFFIMEDEAGIWTVRSDDDGDELEFVTTHQFGQRVSCPLVMVFDRKKGGMCSC